MTDHKITIPAEVHTLVEFRQRDLPGFATVNAALAKFASRAAFPWHLSVLVCCDELIDHRLPSADEQRTLYEFEDQLSPLITANGNALFLARVTHDARREIIWRVYDPDMPNLVLRQILSSKSCPREFDYRIDHDPNWMKAEWYLTGCRSN